MDADGNSMPVGTKVTITLTPEAGAILFDGSAPETIEKSFTIDEQYQYNYWIHDIPQCVYQITAETNLSGVDKVIQLSKDFSEGYGPAIENFFFKPEGGGSGSYENGLETPSDNPFYMHLQ